MVLTALDYPHSTVKGQGIFWRTTPYNPLELHDGAL